MLNDSVYLILTGRTVFNGYEIELSPYVNLPIAIAVLPVPG